MRLTRRQLKVTGLLVNPSTELTQGTQDRPSSQVIATVDIVRVVCGVCMRDLGSTSVVVRLSIGTLPRHHGSTREEESETCITYTNNVAMQVTMIGTCRDEVKKKS